MQREFAIRSLLQSVHSKQNSHALLCYFRQATYTSNHTVTYILECQDRLLLQVILFLLPPNAWLIIAYDLVFILVCLNYIITSADKEHSLLLLLSCMFTECTHVLQTLLNVCRLIICINPVYNCLIPLYCFIFTYIIFHIGEEYITKLFLHGNVVNNDRQMLFHRVI